MLITLSTPTTIGGRPATTIALRSPGREYLNAHPARLGPDGSLADIAIIDFAAWFGGVPPATLRALPGPDQRALRYGVEALIAGELQSQTTRQTVAQDARRRAREGSDDA